MTAIDRVDEERKPSLYITRVVSETEKSLETEEKPSHEQRYPYDYVTVTEETLTTSEVSSSSCFGGDLP